MPRYTEEQIARANETDLVSFLRARGEKLKKSGGRSDQLVKSCQQAA